MPEQMEPVSGANESALLVEIARLNKMIQALMNRAEHNASIQGSDFNLFHTAITLEDQVRRRTGELEAALLENEKITRSLRERENDYRLLLDNAPVSIHEIGMDGRIVSMSRAGVLMHEVKEEAAIQGTLYLDGVSVADRERIAGLLAKAYAGETSHFEFTPGGSHGRVFKSCFVPLKDRNGNVERLMGITEDITERKLAQEETKLKNTILQTQQETSQDAILVVDENAQIISYNQHFIDLWRLPAELVNAHQDGPVLQAVVEQVEDSEAFFARVQYLYGHRDEKSYEELRLKDGRIVERYSAPATGADGRYYGRVWYFRDITERKKAEEQVRNLAFYDSLTQLANRRLLTDRLGQAMAASKRSGRYGAVMFLDLDNFKPLNDKHGHEVGDLLLIEVAHRITSCVRKMDTVARFGGDEFVVMLGELVANKELSAGQAAGVAEKIRVALAEPYLLQRNFCPLPAPGEHGHLPQPPGDEGGLASPVEHHCTSSIGVVLFSDNQAGQEDILKWADMAMYQAKEAGRNRVSFYDGVS